MKLELKHIVPYLPYGLKCRVKDKGKTKFSELSGIYNDCSCVFFDIIESQQGFSEVKPILRPLSDLTKEIDGVVGIVELAKIAAEYWGVDFDVDKISPFGAGVCSTDGCEFGFTGLEFYFLGDEKDSIEINQLTYFEYLFENHYDVYGLIEKGLAIDINTIEK